MSILASPVHPGDVVAQKYEVERALGQGGMGVVVAARHRELDQLVAIKFLVGDAPPAAVERFVREAKAAALVRGEHVCRVYDVGKLDTGEPFIVMEYLEGTDLADKLEGEGPQPIADVAGWIIEACDALASAHAQGIIHRDLKPANLFLQRSADNGETLKVVDFGISKLPKSGALTSTAVMMGSPYYMSPEQLESSRDVDQRSDIWSLGVVMYELLTNAPPFEGESLVQLAVAAREKPPVAPTTLRPDLPSGFERIILRCLAKRPEDRYGSVHELVSDLALFAGPDGVALAQRLLKRAANAGSPASGNRSSDPAIALSQTVASDPKILAANQKTRKDTPAARAGEPPRLVLDMTLSPVLTDTGRTQIRARRWMAVVVAMVAVAGGLIFLVLPRKPLPQAVVSSPPPPTVSLPTTSASALVVSELPAEVPTSSAVPALVSAAPVKPSASPVSSPRPVAHGKTVATGATPVASTAPGPTPAPAPATSGRGRRELDRDYVP